MLAVLVPFILYCLVGILAMSLKWMTPAEWSAGYLILFLFLFQIAFGSLFIQTLHSLTGGNWNSRVIGTLNQNSRLMACAAVVFLPLLFFPSVHQWWNKLQMSVSPSKQTWFSPILMIARAAGFFAIWNYFAWRPMSRERRGMNAVRMIVLVLTVTLCTTDWILSLSPKWHSPIFGLLVLASAFVVAWAFALSLFSNKRDNSIPLVHGNLLFMGICVWAYCWLSQIMVYWMGHLPKNMIWLQVRAVDNWAPVSTVIGGVGFGVPFVLLLIRRLKSNALILFGLALLLLFAHLAENMLWIYPSLQVGPGTFVLPLVAGTLLITGLWYESRRGET